MTTEKTPPILIDTQVAEITVSYSHRIHLKDRIQIKTSQKAEEVLRMIWDHSKIEFQETFKMMLLNRSNHLLGIVTISEGGRCHTVVDLRILFSIALKCAATGIILAHNHPSGNTQPSEADLALQNRITEAGKLLEISVLDHIILTKDSYHSMETHQFTF